jgi:hypothetical protein
LEAMLSDELSGAHLFLKQVLKCLACVVDRTGNVGR